MRPKRSLSGAQSPVVSVRLSRLGERTRVLKLRVGTTINDLVKNEALERSSIRVNKRPVRLASKLKSGDVVGVVPQAIGGGSGRYDHLNLDDCRRRMSAKDFRFFVDFVGADTLGFTDADLEA